MKVAFLTLVHRQIELVYKQIDLLDDKDHFFYIRLDKKYNPGIADDYQRKANVVFSKNRFPISWGGFSIVRATVEVLQTAFAASDRFDYFVLLSGQCLPIKSKRAIVDFLKTNSGKLFLEAHVLPDPALAEGGLDKVRYPYLFDQLGNIKNEYKKLIFRLTKRLLKIVHYRRKLPATLVPCFGSQWWALPREAAGYVLNVIKSQSAMVRFFRYTWAPDELFFQTILYNSRFRESITNRSLWYIDWNTGGPPKTLTRDDYEQLMHSDKLFARKFDLEKSSLLLRGLEQYLRS